MKKGFTLIELLAVIVILAIIAIIAVPIILNVIEKSKEGSAVDSAYGYIHAIEQGVTVREIKDKVVVSNGEYTDLREFENENNITLKGSKPSTGTFTLEKRRVISAELIINGYRVICDKKTCRTSGKADKITITYDTDGGTLSKNSDEIYKGDTLTLPIPEKENYIFMGWYTESNGSGTLVDNNSIITNNMTLHAYYVETTNNFAYTGSVQTFTVPVDGMYKIEVWGAEGGSTTDGSYVYAGGKGGYTGGTIALTKGTKLYVAVGGKGQSCTSGQSNLAGGFNGGGDALDIASSGGGATTISYIDGTIGNGLTKSTSDQILLLAGGGGGAGSYGNGNYNAYGGPGGLTSSKPGGALASVQSLSDWSSNPVNRHSKYNQGAGGGGGATERSVYCSGGTCGGWGGTSYIGDVNIGQEKSGDKSITQPDGTTSIGHSGDGYARITYIGSANIQPGETYNFDYTGSQSKFKAPVAGTYKLEVWGAQGGNSGGGYIGGYGGYSIGIVSMNKNDKLFISIGGQGKENNTSSNVAGGYNGGGKVNETRSETYEGSGGGATHIALDSGYLYDLSSHATDGRILIVAGGGGGSSYYTGGGYSGHGGVGGGYVGGTGTALTNNGTYNGIGGNQTSGGASGASSSDTGSTASKFGKGAEANGKQPTWGISGGGGGYYGGGSGIHSGAGGGSGYIGSSNLISITGLDKHMTCYNCTTSDEENIKTISNTCVNSNPTADCSKTGHGYARITYIGE